MASSAGSLAEKLAEVRTQAGTAANSSNAPAAPPPPLPGTSGSGSITRGAPPDLPQSPPPPPKPNASSGSSVTQLRPGASSGSRQLGNAALAFPSPNENSGAQDKPNSKTSQRPEPSLDVDLPDIDTDTSEPTRKRRTAKRRPSGPARERVAANDDAPSIGGLIYALEQKPSSAPFRYAAMASAVWLLLGAGFAGYAFYEDVSRGADFGSLLLQPQAFFLLTAIAVPIALIWFLAVLSWRSEELRLRSSTMTEVAIRLAEPDRMAEQSVVSLGQAVRRQVSFMNDAVTRALGRAGELEALVHNEVTALERSYEENERKIRGLIEELSGERFQLLDTSERIVTTLDQMGTRVPELLESLTAQQQKLAHIVEGAGDNLEMLESSLSGRTEQLQTVLTDYTGAIDTSLETRTDAMKHLLADHSKVIDAKIVGEHEKLEVVLGGHSGKLEETLETQNARMQSVLQDYTMALASALGSRSDDMQITFEKNMVTLDSSIANRTETLQTVFEAYAQALDTTIARRAEALDSNLVDRTRALDEAFSERLQMFDAAIYRSTSAIDTAVTERAQALAHALEDHARDFKETMTVQAADLDESMALGINAVRRSSENITRQSIKAIEGIANQSDLLKNVSESLLAQINSVTNRFDAQGQTIMKAANALESANFKIDNTLQNRHAELAQTLDRMSGKAEEFGRFVEGYSSSIEGTLSDAELRARAVAEELKSGAQVQQRIMLEDLERFRTHTDTQSERAVDEVRQRFSRVSDEVSSQLGSLTSRIDETGADVRKRAEQVTTEVSSQLGSLSNSIDATGADVRRRAEQVSSEVTNQLGTLTSRFDATSEDMRRKAEATTTSLTAEQDRLRAQIDSLPKTAQQSTDAVRRALQDQLRALEDLSHYTNTEARVRDVTPPVGGGGSAGPGNGPRPTISGPAAPQRSLSSLSDKLAREMSERGGESAGEPTQPDVAARPAPQRPSATAPSSAPLARRAAPAPASSAPTPQPTSGRPQQASVSGGGREGWSVGDLLKRASDGSDAGGATPLAPAAPFDVQALARWLSADAAMDVWTRLRSGQRGFMTPSIYAPEGQAGFRDLSERHARDTQLQKMVTNYLAEFESALRDAEARDPSGATVGRQLVSDGGRVYLVLAHASGRLN